MVGLDIHEESSYFIQSVGGPSRQCPVALSSPVEFHDHSEKSLKNPVVNSNALPLSEL